MTWNRPQKNEVRQWVFQNGRPIARYLCLPGEQLACIEEGITQRKITKSTEIIAVERKEDIASCINTRLNTLGNQFQLHTGELHFLCYTDPVDFAYFDLMGKLNIPLANWLANLTLRKRSRIAITVQSHKVRSPGKLMKAVSSSEHQDIPSFDDQASQDVASLLKMIFNRHTFDFQGHRIHADTKRSPMMTFKLGNFQRAKLGNVSPSYSHLFRRGSY